MEPTAAFESGPSWVSRGNVVGIWQGSVGFARALSEPFHSWMICEYLEPASYLQSWRGWTNKSHPHRSKVPKTYRDITTISLYSTL